MKIYWKCSCGNVNRFESKEMLFFTYEQKEKMVGTDNCAKCNKEHDFELELKILDQS